MQFHIKNTLGFLMLAAAISGARAAEKPTIAVLPFSAPSAEERELGDKARFALAAKISRDGAYDRKDAAEVDDTISALMIPVAEATPSAEEIKKIAETLKVDRVIIGQVQGRQVTAWLYEADQKLATTRATIPGGKESPKLTYEKMLADLLALKFEHVREIECDHSDPATEKRFAERPNLCPDPGFEEAARTPAKKAAQWGAILGPDRYNPPVINSGAVADLPQDRVAVVARADGSGHFLLMRMGKGVSESNGLACESVWIPVENGAKYRFTVRYRSTGPRLRLFLKGFAVKGDQYGDKSDPEAVRREYYRFQVLPREKNEDWELIEADFTPESEKNHDYPKVQWLRVDLFIYLHPGDVQFDDVVVKKISP